MKNERLYPVGAEVVPGGVSFRVFADQCQKVEVVHYKSVKEKLFYALQSENNGYFSGTLSELAANSLYAFRLDEGDEYYADPASRYQPEGPLGPSEVVDPHSFKWENFNWKGADFKQKIIYEMHIGTFTQEGTFKAAEEKLSELADLGVNILELMPLNEFPGKFGWGYDGVNLFAPYHIYGKPDDVKNFIQEAHRLNIAVILDVVYNHFGPQGNFLDCFSKSYFLKEDTEWGRAINFDKEEIRDFFLTNVRYWIEEFQFDGLRLDATQSIFCKTYPHILAEISKVAREAGKNRTVFVIGENEPQHSILIRPLEKNGYGLDALWDDDFHHSAMVRLMGKKGAYYKDYRGTVQEFISSLKYGFLFQGQYYVWQDQNRGSSSLDLPYQSFIHFIQNHDQIANSGNGLRIHQLTDPGNLRAMTCLFLIGPQIPLLFQGQEFMATSPFLYFADYNDKMAELICEGRKKSLEQFENLATEEMQEDLPSPTDPKTFERCKLKWEEKFNPPYAYFLHKDLLFLKKYDPVFSDQFVRVDGAVLDQDSFAIRFFSRFGERLLLINLGIDRSLIPVSDPIFAHPEGKKWEMLWSSESVKYGGQGSIPFEENQWFAMGHSAIILCDKVRESV